jgi:hypothetical protein
VEKIVVGGEKFDEYLLWEGAKSSSDRCSHMDSEVMKRVRNQELKPRMNYGERIIKSHASEWPEVQVNGFCHLSFIYLSICPSIHHLSIIYYHLSFIYHLSIIIICIIYKLPTIYLTSYFSAW